MMALWQKPDDYITPDLLPVLYSADDIQQRMRGIAQEIITQYGREFVIVGLLKGSFVFMADLVRALHHAGCTPQVDFMILSSYGDEKSSSGTVTIHRAIGDDISGKAVLLVDDILESGRTMHAARELMNAHGASAVKLCVLLDKPGKRFHDFDADFVGFTIEDRFVVGYGLDYAGYYRELPFIGTMD